MKRGETVQNEGAERARLAAGESCAHALHCLEIWGGNESVHTSVSVPGLNAWLFSEPAGGATQGGDLYYVSTCGAGRISRFVIADVSGHGATAGDMAMKLRGLMRRYVYKLDQSQFARSLNSEFRRRAGCGRFATALLATYFAPTNQIIICNAGHPRPIYYQAASRRWILLDELSSRHEAAQPPPARQLRNLPLGIIHPTTFVQFTMTLGVGDLLLIYTDPLVEAINRQGQLLGEQGLLELVSGLDPAQPEQLTQSVCQTIRTYRCGAPRDDRTLLVLHHNGGDPPRQSISKKIHTLARMLGMVSDAR